MGGPSAAIVLHELAELGVRRAIRVGTCGALADDLRRGDLVVAGEALADDGTSRAIGAAASARPDAELTARLVSAVGLEDAAAPVVSTDLFYDDTAGDVRRPAAWREHGAVAVEMEAATLFTLGARLGIAAACVLVVTDTFASGERQRIDDEQLAAAVERMGAAAAEALAG
jgi:uridine phosphorylase